MADYHKQHIVPAMEGDLTPGHVDTVRKLDGNTYGLAIHRDMLFSDFGRSYGRLNVSSMLVPAWDFYVDAQMASGVAAMRGVEKRMLRSKSGTQKLPQRH